MVAFMSHAATLRKTRRLKSSVLLLYIHCRNFFSVISALSIKEVKQYFRHKLKSRGREDHVVKLLVDKDKQLDLTYYIKRGQLTITFKYGEWNTTNYPFHDCFFNVSEVKLRL